MGLACYHLGSFQDQHVLWWEPWDLVTEVSWADTCVGRMILCCLSECLQYLPTRNFVLKYTSNHPKDKSSCWHHLDMELFTRPRSSLRVTVQIHLLYSECCFALQQEPKWGWACSAVCCVHVLNILRVKNCLSSADKMCDCGNTQLSISKSAQW